MHGLGTLGRIRSGPASLPLAKLGSQPILAQRPLAEWKAGPWTPPRRGVRVPAPEEKQGVRADRDDDVRADGVARPAGGDEQVRADFGQETSRSGKAGPHVLPATGACAYMREAKAGRSARRPCRGTG